MGGVTEAEFAVIAFFAAPACFGRGVYDLAIPITWAAMDLRLLIALVFTVLFVGKIAVVIAQVMSRTRRPQALKSLLPIVLHNIVAGVFLCSASARAHPPLCFALTTANV